MTVSSTTNRVATNGNGVTTTYPVTFPFHDEADLIVLSTVILTGVSTTQTITTDYTITGTPDDLGHYSSGGAVEFVSPPASTVRITIYRDPARTQGLDMQDLSSFPAESVEAQFDYLTMLSQRNADLVTRSLRQPDSDPATMTDLPTVTARAGMYLGFDDNGDPVALAETTSLGVLLTTTSASSLAIGTGAKTFTVSTGLNFSPGQFILAASAANNANYMHGFVTSYSGTTLIANITNVGGSGTLADWLISISGSRGAPGADGADGAAGTAVVPIAAGAGTVDAITADYTPDIALADMQLAAFVSAGANTSTTPSFTPDGLTTRTIVKKGGVALRAGDTGAAGHVCLMEYNLANTRWELLNPATDNQTTSGSVATTTSGTAHDFTGIPAGVKRITVSFSSTTLSGSDSLLVQIGDAGGFETSGYTAISHTINSGGVGGATSTSGFVIRNAGYAISGHLILTLIDAATFTWVASGVQMLVISNTSATSSGSKSLSAELTQVRITRSGSNTFTAGKVNILYEY